MQRALSFAGLILAAGESSRMGSDKALLPWRGRTFLEAHIAALQPHADFVLVVAGKNCGTLEPIVDAQAAFLVVNPQPDRGQFSSLQIGLQEILNRGRDAAIISLVDRPPTESPTIASLRCTLEHAPRDVWAVAPVYNGQHGHPLVAGREMITAFLQASTSGNARAVERTHHEHISYFAVDDRFTVLNIDTPEDYNHLIS
jgi:molybdenum cofactor cytidylyltransferase